MTRLLSRPGASIASFVTLAVPPRILLEEGITLSKMADRLIEPR